MSKLWRNLKELVGVSTPQDDELNRSRYSLVSSGDLTADTLKLWMELPEEIKFDPSLAPLRQMYEKEHGKIKCNKKHVHRHKRLPFVKSAPVIAHELHVVNNVHKQNAIVEEDEKQDDEPNGFRVATASSAQPKTNKIQVGKHYVKMTILLACWVFFTVVFLTYNEKKEVVRHTFLTPEDIKYYTVPASEDHLSLELKLSGPFVAENTELKLNSSNHDHLEAWLERWALRNGSEAVEGTNVVKIEKSVPWNLTLFKEDELDFNTGEPRYSKLRLDSNDSYSAVYYIAMRKSGNGTTPLTISYSLNPLDAGSGVAYCLVLLCGLYILIIFEVINRTMAAILVSTMSLAVLAVAGERPSIPEVVSWLDIETLILLFSMMILVAITAETGIFDYLAVYTFEVTKGKLWPLIFLLCTITASLSTFLDNVTTVLLMSPVTIRLCEVMDLNPVPILMFMAIFSNVGGSATPVGDPPNVIVASNRAVVQSGINFTNFTAHMGLGIIFIMLQTCLQIRFMFRDSNKLKLSVPREIQDLRHQISIWRRAAESLPQMSQGVHIVRERLERKINKLTLEMEMLIKENSARACPKNSFESTLAELKNKYKIRDKKLLIQASIAISFVVIVFFLHSLPELNRVSLGWTALLGAILLLVLADREDLEPILHRVEWTTLLFFAALFVLMEALSKLGLILYIGGLMEQLILKVDEGARLAVALMLILWVSGLISGFVDNIPLTTMMVRVVVTIGSNPRLNLPLPPLVWALLFGACLGGNSTLIGASANVVCAGVAEQHGYKFTFMEFLKVGFPLVIGHLTVSSVYLLICHCVFEWH